MAHIACYRLIANPDLPDLGFVGLNSSFCTVLCADMAAHWLVRYAQQPAQAADASARCATTSR